MLHVFQPTAFSDPARQHLFEAVREALRSGLPADAPALLAGPLPLPDGRVADAVLVRPHSLTLLLLHPGAGGELRISSFTAQPWTLAGTPVVLPDRALNPYQSFAQLSPDVLAFLEPMLPPEAVNPRFVTGLWLTNGPLRFGPDVEASMAAAPEARQLQLLPELARLPRRLAQLATPEIELTAADIQHLATVLPDVLAGPAPALSGADDETSATLGSVVHNTARQLWRWLGAEDVDELPPDTYALAARSEDQKHALEEQQAALQRQLNEQLQAIEAREAAREQSMAQLRAELTQAQQQAAPNAAELQARLAAESRAQAAEDARLQTAQAEWQRRNQDLDAKINALEQLIQRLQAPAAAPAASPSAPPPNPARAAEPEPTTRPAAAATVAAAAASPPANPRPAPAPAAAVPPVGPPPTRPATEPALGERLRGGLHWVRSVARPLLGPVRRHLPASDHWLWLALGGGLGLGLMLWLGTQVFKGPPPEPYQADGRWGFARRGEPVVPAQYASVQPFQDERAVVERDGAFGAVTADGQEVVPPAYDAMNSYADGYARVRIGDLYTFVDADGREFSHYFYNAYDFAEGYAPVLDQRGWFYISGPDAGVPAHPRVFQEAYPFRDGLARVRTGGAYTFISPGQLADTTQAATFGRYEQATDFADGRARVQQNGRRFVIDGEGEEIAE
ncbi:WG repeat-containing protein [Hymenobacter edaphi]|uniref:WG repeat-containing protein n=1 Tax=Hymenobacter edaphi TaxID=2211146 RepID=A0A328BQ65_9BACT|nr:WG repeat-containing protein [Hymenobacter edaphi]RAK68146.1 hypothetical protein DLM85_08905 [Hymenobacter edaphi]